jgi:hypothetical protein
VAHSPVRGKHHALRARACDTSRHKTLPFHHVIGSTAVSSFYWLDMCRLWFGGLLLVCFCFLLLFSLIFKKIIIWPLLLLFVFQLHSLLFWFLIFCSWFFCKKIICFQFLPSIPICHILFFSIWSSFFWFFCSFVKLIFLFNFTFQSKTCLYF